MKTENLIEKDLVKSMKPKVINVPGEASGEKCIINNTTERHFINYEN